jgi:hypothetical protein
MKNSGALRRSHSINRRPAVNIHHATRYADTIGLPLNRFVTINLTLAACTEERAVRTFRKLLNERFCPWLRRTHNNDNEAVPTHVWTVEAAGGQIAAHWLVHVPKRLRASFPKMVAAWLGSVSGSKPPPEAVEVKPIHNLIGVKRYILKGTDAPWARHLGVMPIDQGEVIGKRSGFSRNLGPTARKAGGYVPRRVPGAATGPGSGRTPCR